MNPSLRKDSAISGMSTTFDEHALAGVDVLKYGAATYIVKGKMMKAAVRQYNICCEELPITIFHKNESFEAFADARSMVIRSLCTARLCDSALDYFYAIIPFNNEEQNQNTKRWLCTRKNSTIGPCMYHPYLVDIKQTEDLKIGGLLKKGIKESIYSKEIRKSHFLASLISQAKEAIPSTTLGKGLMYL